MNTSTTNINDNWIDLKSGGVKNIRVRGTYPNVHRKYYNTSHYHPNCSPFLLNQHKPYGLATVGLINPFDDRPDWFLFHKRHKRKYEEITPADKEDFYQAMEQDHDMHISHHHVHIKEVKPNTKPSDEIENEIIL
jgi:hypothetical protein